MDSKTKKTGEYAHEEKPWHRKDTTLIRISKETAERVKMVAARAGRKTWRTADRLLAHALDDMLGCRFFDGGYCNLKAGEVQCAGSRKVCEHDDFTSGKLYI